MLGFASVAPKGTCVCLHSVQILLWVGFLPSSTPFSASLHIVLGHIQCLGLASAGYGSLFFPCLLFYPPWEFLRCPPRHHLSLSSLFEIIIVTFFGTFLNGILKPSLVFCVPLSDFITFLFPGFSCSSLLMSKRVRFPNSAALSNVLTIERHFHSGNLTCSTVEDILTLFPPVLWSRELPVLHHSSFSASKWEGTPPQITFLPQFSHF